MPKPTKTAAELDALIAERLNALPELLEDLAGKPNLHVVASPVYRHERDDGGANWSIATGRNTGPYTAALMDIVSELRTKFDLTE